MRATSLLVAAISLIAMCTHASAGEVERHAIWPGLEEWLAAEGDGYVVPTVETTDWKGFVSEGNRVRGLDAGDRFRYVFERDGTFYLGTVLLDDPDGIERLRVTLGEREIGTIVGDADSGKALYSFAEPVTVKKGDALEFTCMTPVGCYRIYDLVFAKRRILPPTPSFRHIEAWARRAGEIDICWVTTGIVGTGQLEYGTADVTHTSAQQRAKGRNHRIRLKNLDLDAAYTGRIVTEWQGEELVSNAFTFRAAPANPQSTERQTIELVVMEPTEKVRRAWPVTIGVPFQRGALAGVSDLALVDPKGTRVALQAEATALWDDGSVKWATLNFLADSSNASAPEAYRLQASPDRNGQSTNTSRVLSIAETPEGWELRSAALSFTIGKKSPTYFGRFGFDGDGNGQIDSNEHVTGTEASGLVLETKDGQSLTCAAPETIDVEENGPIRAVVRCEGSLQGPDSESGWRYLLRLTFWQGMPGMAINVSVWNGDEEPLFHKVRSLSLNVPLANDASRRAAFQGGVLKPVPEGQPMRLLQDSDTHYSQSCGADLEEGERALGLATVSHGEGLLSVLVRDFWQTYPSGLEVSTPGTTVELLPALAQDAYTVGKDQDWFYRLYPWFDDGCYLMRAGQSTQSEVFAWFDTDTAGEMAKKRAAWFARPLLPQASPEYLCSTQTLGAGLFPKTPGVWDSYDAFFEQGFAQLSELRESNRMYGWMNFGDWYGERGYNAGNNEYDLAWCLGLQWMRTGDRRYLERALEMARHYATIDTIRGDWTNKLPGVVWEHSFNHVGTRRSPEELGFDEHAKGYAKGEIGTFLGGNDPQGHIFEDGIWLCGLLTGDRFLLDTAERVCARQAEFLTPTFDFEIERGGGWPLINATGAYMFTGNPYFLNAARIMVERCLERHDPEHGGWPHVPPLNETQGEPVVGGKAFATGILTFGLLRYLEVEPLERPDVSQMLLNTADWLMNESWEPGNGFVYITNSPKHVGQGHRGHECLMNAEIIGYAYETTGDEKYLEFWQEVMAGAFDGGPSAFGKGFSQQTRQTVFGLDRARKAGITDTRRLE